MAVLTVLVDRGPADISHIELIATPLLAPVLTISGLADLTAIHQIDVSADGDGTQ